MMHGYRLVLVEWHDSFGCSAEWRETTDMVPPDAHHVCYSVGFLVHETPETIVVAGHLSPATSYAEEQGCGEMVIPRKAIVSITGLETEGGR